MVKSSFSGKDIPPGKGVMYVKKDGKILYFLNKKEEKNMLKLRRKPRTVAWTEEYRKEKGQRIAIAQHAAEHAHGEETKKPTKKTAAKKATKQSPDNKAKTTKKATKKTTKKVKK